MINLKYRTIKAFLQLSKHRAYAQSDKQELIDLETELETAYKESKASVMTEIANRLVNVGETLVRLEKMAA